MGVDARTRSLCSSFSAFTLQRVVLAGLGGRGADGGVHNSLLTQPISASGWLPHLPKGVSDSTHEYQNLHKVVMYQYQAQHMREGSAFGNLFLAWALRSGEG